MHMEQKAAPNTQNNFFGMIRVNHKISSVKKYILSTLIKQKLKKSKFQAKNVNLIIP